MTEPIYIVSGFPRSGTSMMMRALESGGIPCVYSTTGDDERNGRGTHGYVPNPHGFYENADLWNVDWSTYRGRAVKVIHGNLHTLPTGEVLRVVYMVRCPHEIRASMAAIGESVAFCESPESYAAKVASDLTKLPGAVVIGHAEVVADPVRQFSRLGWPFDVARAADTIDQALYRHRGAA